MDTQEGAEASRRAPARARRTTKVAHGSALLSRSDRAFTRVRTSIQALRARRASLLAEIALVAASGVGLLLLLALLSFHPRDRQAGAWDALVQDEPVRNWVGPAGALIADATFSLLGVTAFALPLLLVVAGVGLFGRRTRRPRIGEIVGLLGLLASGSALVQLVFPDVAFRGAVIPGGGFAGEMLAAVLIGWFSVPGAWVLGLTALVVSARLAFGASVFRMTGALGRRSFALAVAGASGGLSALAAGVRGAGGWIAGGLRSGRDGLDDWRHERALLREEERWARQERLARRRAGLAAPCDGDPGGVDVQPRATADASGAEPAGQDPDESGGERSRASRVRWPERRTGTAASSPAPAEEAPDVPEDDLQGQEGEPEVDLDAPGLDSLPVTASEADGLAAVEAVPVPACERVDSMRGAAARGVVHARIDVGGHRPGALRSEIGPAAEAGDDGPGTGPVAGTPGAPMPRPSTAEMSVSAPRIHEAAAKDPGAAHVDRVVSARRLVRQRDEPFELPPLGLLDLPGQAAVEADELELERQAARLEETLGHYGVEGHVTDILPGPVVTMFEFEPAPGIKVSRIANLGDDLAMALRALKVRIVAPIPGKGAVGIEVPSAHREMVNFREVLASSAFRAGKKQLPIALGKAIDGSPVCSDMVKMPHILVAGTTGSGKSVCVNTVILSLLFSRTPDEVRLILVDPKMLEFSVYDGIPHLLVPVVTSPKKAAVALNWAVQEMGRRYKVLSAMGARSIANYNEKAAKLAEQWEAFERDRRAGRDALPPDCGRAAGEDTVCFRSEGFDPVGPPEQMPFIVIVIDELADLMMVARKEVEESVVRLAQMARAAGLHLLVATQRPSVDVITGLIKANFPTRLSFRVSSKVDSRTVLDANGAECLLGLGDGLFLAPGVSDLLRVHGAFVTDDEVGRVVDHLKTQGDPEYVDAVLVSPDGDPEDEEEQDGELDPMYDECVAVVAEAGKASTSLLQRRLKLGYNRAARIMDAMERHGVIGPQDGARPRDVYVKPYDV